MANKSRKKRAMDKGSPQERRTGKTMGCLLVFGAVILTLSLLAAPKHSYVFTNRHGLDLALAIFLFLEGFVGRKILSTVGLSAIVVVIGLFWFGVKQLGGFALGGTRKGISVFALLFVCVFLTGALLDWQWYASNPYLSGNVGSIVASNLIYSIGKPAAVGLTVAVWGTLIFVVFGSRPIKVALSAVSKVKASRSAQKKDKEKIQPELHRRHSTTHTEKDSEGGKIGKGADGPGETGSSIATSVASVCCDRVSRVPACRKPPLDILDPVEHIQEWTDRVEETVQQIESKLFEMNIGAAVHKTRPGPVITRYEIMLKRGERLKNVLGAKQDLSLALGAPVRIVTASEKGLIGVEVPNAERTKIPLRALLNGPLPHKQKGNRLTVPVGVTPQDEPFHMDLSLAPHLLVAGATGSGKSLFMNALIVSLAYCHSPAELRLILVDPKMVEFPVFNNMPHLLHPVATDSATCGDLFTWLTEEMEGRYSSLAKSKCRDIKSFREKKGASNKGSMPYIVVVVDEFADLFLAKARNLEQSVIRLAQKARAVGIHLIMATQRPSTDVVSGLIKANFPSRLAFKVSTAIDSRVILDEEGAESLLGNGDMLLRHPEVPGTQRLHGAFVSQPEIERVVNFLRNG